MNATLRVSGEPAAVEAPYAASGPRPIPVPHGGREAALTMAREALASHMARAEEWRRVLEEIEHG